MLTENDRNLRRSPGHQAAAESVGRAAQAPNRWAASALRIGLPPTNDFVSEHALSAPAAHAHGQRHHHYDGHLWYSGAPPPGYPECSRTTARRADLYFSINQVRVIPELVPAREGPAGEPGEPGAEVLLRLEHSTPNFAHYEVRVGFGHIVTPTVEILNLLVHLV